MEEESKPELPATIPCARPDDPDESWTIDLARDDLDDDDPAASIA